MSDPTILFVKPQAMRAKDKKALAEAGVIVVEIDDPVNVKLIRAGAELSSTALLGAAARAMRTAEYSDATKKAFAIAVCELLEAAAQPNGSASAPSAEGSD